nr:hypothetical protein [Paraburkholderia sp. ZP32-5]
MRMILFSSRQYDSETFTEANAAHGYELHFQESHLDSETAILAHGYDVVCPFVNDLVDAATLEQLHAGGTRMIALRSAGFNHVDLAAAERLGMLVARVPAYSPHAVAEHAVGLILALNRRLPRAVARTREGDFSLHGLLGFDLHGKTGGGLDGSHAGDRAACRRAALRRRTTRRCRRRRPAGSRESRCGRHRPRRTVRAATPPRARALRPDTSARPRRPGSARDAGRCETRPRPRARHRASRAAPARDASRSSRTASAECGGCRDREIRECRALYRHAIRRPASAHSRCRRDPRT